MGDEDLFEQSKDNVFLVIVIPVIFIFIILTITLFGRFAVKNFDVDELHHTMIIERLILSEDCFAFYDSGVKTGIIDAGKFNDGQLKRCINLEGKNIGIKAALTYDGKVKNAIENELMINREFLCGKAALCSEESLFVLVNDNGLNELKNGRLELLVIELKD